MAIGNNLDPNHREPEYNHPMPDTFPTLHSGGGRLPPYEFDEDHAMKVADNYDQMMGEPYHVMTSPERDKFEEVLFGSLEKRFHGRSTGFAR